MGLHKTKKGREGLVPQQVLTRRRGLFAKLTVVALVTSMLVIGAAPAGAAIDTTASCPTNTPSAGFTDIGGFDATTQRAINCLVMFGISQGTSATTFSPNGSVARWQMALFLTRQAVDHGIALPSGASQGFTDIGSFDAATQTAINQLKQLNITQGTSATTFEPNLIVTRWQMALFLIRLAAAAGVTLPSGASQGFTDIGSLSTEAQTAINQAKQLGIADGFSATTFSPNTDTLRWQMALFLTRVLAVDNIFPSGIGAYVTRFNAADNTADRYQVADPVTCTTSLVSYAATGTTFSINGASSSKAAFEAALGGLAFPANVIQASSSSTHHSITTGVTVGSGTVDTPNFATTFNIVEPVTGSVLRTVTYDQAFDSYTVGGAAATPGGFDSNINAGDTVVITGGNGTSAAQARTIALTNNTVSGNVGDPLAAPNVNVNTSCPAFVLDTTAPGTDTHTYTVGGSTVTAAAFHTAATSNDLITYARANGTSAWTLTNQAPAPFSGKVYTFAMGVSDTVGIAVSSTSAQTVTYDGPGDQVLTLRVNGIDSTLAEFQAALDLADDIVFQADNPATGADESSLSITNQMFGGVPNTDPVGTTITVLINGQQSAPVVDFAAIQPAEIGGTATTAPTYTVNGAASNLAGFQAGVDLAIANAAGSVSVTQPGTSLVWNVNTTG
jgi:hypothetical protein